LCFDANTEIVKKRDTEKEQDSETTDPELTTTFVVVTLN